MEFRLELMLPSCLAGKQAPQCYPRSKVWIPSTHTTPGVFTYMPCALARTECQMIRKHAHNGLLLGSDRRLSKLLMRGLFQTYGAACKVMSDNDPRSWRLKGYGGTRVSASAIPIMKSCQVLSPYTPEGEG